MSKSRIGQTVKIQGSTRYNGLYGIIVYTNTDANSVEEYVVLVGDKLTLCNEHHLTPPIEKHLLPGDYFYTFPCPDNLTVPTSGWKQDDTNNNLVDGVAAHSNHLHPQQNCKHSYKLYTGLYESYRYCTECDKKVL